ncbi:GNAT family N-acetyltransferase [Streptomyces parvus]|uniref:GNAT family N-acetyltransferase n=1 Tax=Streptomyces parvus TaxID=66428 RepID=UPI0037FF566C
MLAVARRPLIREARASERWTTGTASSFARSSSGLSADQRGGGHAARRVPLLLPFQEGAVRLSQLVAYEKARPRYQHWYLIDIAVDGTARGLGIGSALLAHRLASIDAQAAPAYLEATAPANQRLYERFGFPLAPTQNGRDQCVPRRTTARSRGAGQLRWHRPEDHR